MTDEPTSDTPASTPEGYTEEQPAPSELGEPGTPGAGLSPAVPHAADADESHHDAATHMDAHTVLPEDDHGHPETALGPIDWRAWGFALVGALGGLVVLYFFWVAVS